MGDVVKAVLLGAAILLALAIIITLATGGDPCNLPAAHAASDR